MSKDHKPERGPARPVHPFGVPRGGWQRLVGRHRGDRPGPKVICLGGLHGNEPSGVIAVRRVLDTLERRKLPFCGELVGLAGNLAALRTEQRYLERDLNRMWTRELLARALAPPRVEGVRAGPGSGHQAEWTELAELHAHLREEIDGQDREVYLLDLHTSSADGVPFACIGDTLRNRRFARPFPLPVLLGLEEQLDGSLLEYLNNHGLVTLGFEAGQHREAHSVDRHEAGIWIGLASAGCFPGPQPAEVEQGRRLLADARGGLPAVSEILHRHGLRPNDGFRMHPGYENFTPVQAGEILAEDRAGLVRSPMRGRVMLPLYQGKGEDGFFVARRVRRFWLKLSALLRLARCEALLPWLPGVRRAPGDPDTLLVDRRVARWYSLQIFHLFGYRKRRSDGDALIVSRRRFDLQPPESWRLDG